MEQYMNGPTVTVAVADTSIGLPATTLVPTSGPLVAQTLEQATIQAVGALYLETGGGDATAASFPMAAGDIIQLTGYNNLKMVRFIRNTNTTSIVVIPSYR